MPETPQRRRRAEAPPPPRRRPSSRSRWSRRSRSTACAASTDAPSPMTAASSSTRTLPWRRARSVALRPEPFGALVYSLRHPEAVLPEVEAAGRRRRGARRAPHAPRRARRLRRARRPAPRLREGAGRPRPLADDRAPGDRRMTAVLPERPVGRPADRPVRVRPRRADLPDLGAHLRLQPGVRALPVLLGTARPARAVHRRGRGGHRRAAADAGLLRQRRRRRADGPAGLLGPARLRDRPRRRRQVLHQRRQAGQARAAQLAGTDYVDVQISLDGATAEVNDASAAPAPSPPPPGRWRTWPRPG